jgi:hypothetical protein
MLQTTVDVESSWRRRARRGGRLAAGLAALLFAAAAGDGRSPPLIGNLAGADLTAYPSACECEFVRGAIEWGDVYTASADRHNVVFATREERRAAFMSLDGTLVRFELVERWGEGDCKAGATRVERWQGLSGSSLKVELRTLRPGEEACWYRGKLTAKSGKRTQSIPITGACGC